jgi:hypothetical protein
LVETVRREPAAFGLARSRWRLADLRQVVPWLRAYTDSGVAKALHRLGIHLKRGRLRLHSPDPAYATKAERVERLLATARARPDRAAVYFGDELSIYRQPTLAQRWYPGKEEPTAALSPRKNHRHRIGGALEAVTGRVVRVDGATVGVAKLGQLLRDLRAADPDRTLFLVWDNWPIHRHPTVLAEARRQRIRLVWLPTYAPWLNPIEQLWRWVKQTVIHHHHRADDWAGLQAAVQTFLDQFAAGSNDLLRYVGLIPK